MTRRDILPYILLKKDCPRSRITFIEMSWMSYVLPEGEHPPGSSSRCGGVTFFSSSRALMVYRLLVSFVRLSQGSFMTGRTLGTPPTADDFMSASRILRDILRCSSSLGATSK